MCGIVGYIDFKKNTDNNVLVEMVDSLKHRGPNFQDHKIWNTENCSVGFGHTRLSIIDLSPNSNQPMCREDLGLSIVYNGEIYNYSEIRDELISLNYCFYTNSDTEVILLAFHRWGKGCLNKFNGMFSFAIYNIFEKKLFLARDRVGVKPLYYYYTNDIFIFSSELKSFHLHPRFFKDINVDSIASFLRLGFIPSPYTIFKNCYKLNPGNYLSFNLENKNYDLIKYWDLTHFFSLDKFRKTESEILEDVESLLKSSFNYRMISDAPVGLFLSGGIDSSSVAAIIQANQKDKINTFSIGFVENDFNEAPYAKEIANFINSNHREFYCTSSDARSLIEHMPKVYDEPFGDSSAIPTLLISKFASEHVSVVLCGDGGDEIFCGYGKYWENRTQFDKIANLNGLNKKLLLNFLNVLHYFDFDSYLPELLSNKMFKTIRVLNESDFRSKYRYRIEPFHINDFQLSKLFYNKFQNQSTIYDKMNLYGINASILDTLMSTDFQTNLVDDLLVKVDRATMYFGLEAREPLLDYRLIEYLAQVPSEIKFKNNISKYLLKKIIFKYIPKSLLDRPKMGFAIPKDIWLRGELSKFTKEIILDTDTGIFKKEELSNILNNYYKNKKSDPEKIWNLLMLNLWWNEWM